MHILPHSRRRWFLGYARLVFTLHLAGLQYMTGPSQLVCSWSIINTKHIGMGGKKQWTRILCISPLLIGMLHCPIRLHLKSASSKVTFLRISRWLYWELTKYGDCTSLHVCEVDPGLAWCYFAEIRSSFWPVELLLVYSTWKSLTKVGCPGSHRRMLFLLAREVR